MREVTTTLGSTGASPPTGDVAFLFTDVEGSTALWEHQPDLMEVALAEHDRRMRLAIDEHGGYVFTTAGDSFAVAFPTADAALQAAIAMQHHFSTPCADVSIRVRIGVHAGAASSRDGDYFGAAVNRCARVMSAAHGGQIVLSWSATDLVRDHLPSGVELLDLGEHRLKDLLRPERIHQVCVPDLERSFAPLRTLSGPSSNLPVQFTSFLGRDAELEESVELLARHRLVTFTGAGGAGKTRLALQLGAEASESFPDGVRLVELETATALEQVEDAFAAALEIRAVPDTPLRETLASGIGERRLLLVVDNCEHVIDAAHAVLADLLRRCPNLKVVATSRERLGIAGEAHYPVPPLSMPEARTADDISSFGAVRLFVDRAVLARPGFALDAGNAGAIGAICRRLDGIPLAIELAAARARVLTPQQIADRLDARFELLGTTDRGAVERHRTLAATIAWSYEQLTEAEQTVFRSAGVFAGNFTIEAAEVVCADDGVSSFEVLDIVAGLVDKSMLVLDDDVDQAVRYRMLESMRHYGASLDADLEPARARHVGFYTELALALQARQRGADVAGALEGFDADVENIRAALRWSFDQEEFATAARIIGAVGYLWYASGAFLEGGRWCAELFADEPDLPDELLADALHSYGLVLGSWAQPEMGVEMMRRQIEIRRRIAEPIRLASALNNLGNLLTDLGQHEEAADVLREAIHEFRRAGQPATLSLVSLGFISRDRGDYAIAREVCAEALEEAGRHSDPYGLAVARSANGEVAMLAGDIDEGSALLALARADFERQRVQPGVAYCDLMLGLAATRSGDRVAAAKKLVEALADPDGHWYLSAKFWAIQLGAGLIDDRALAASWLGTVIQQYDDSDQHQPAWVVGHLAALRAAIADDLGVGTTDRAIASGRGNSVPEVTEAVVSELRGIARPDDAPTERRAQGGRHGS